MFNIGVNAQSLIDTNLQDFGITEEQLCFQRLDYCLFWYTIVFMVYYCVLLIFVSGA